MSGFVRFKDWLGQQKTQLSEAVGRYRNRDFMEAVVAGCALVAAADGQISAAEKQKMAGFIQRSDELKVFDMQQVIARFNEFAEGFAFDALIGKASALRTVGQLKRNPEAARLLVRVCCAIGAADGDFDDQEQAVVREICRELALNPVEFGLADSLPTPQRSLSGAEGSGAEGSEIACPERSRREGSGAEPASSVSPTPQPPAPPPAANYAATAQDKAYLEAVIAAAALLTWAEPAAQITQPAPLLRLLQQQPSLQAFDGALIAKQFKRMGDNFSFNPVIAKAQALQALQALRSNAAAVTALQTLCQTWMLEPSVQQHPQSAQAVLAEMLAALGA